MRPRGETRMQLVGRVAGAYGLVLFLILATFVVTLTLSPEGWAGRAAANFLAALTAVMGLISSDVSPGRIRLAGLAAATSFAATVVARPLDSDLLLGVAFLIVAALLLITAGAILRRVVMAAQVDFRTILGAISVYTLIGLLFGYIYIALGRLENGDVFTGVSNAQANDYLFFSYTTLTTTGYGNLVPKGDVGQILAVFEMLMGQIFLVTLVAGLVSLWRPRRREEPAGD